MNKPSAAELLAELNKKMAAISESQNGLNERMAAIESRTQQDPAPASAGGLLPGLEDEAKNFSFARAIYAQHTGDWSRAGFEFEVMREAAKVYDYSPTTAEVKGAQRALASGSGAGSHLVPAEVTSMLIPLIRDKLAITRLGLTELQLGGRGNSVKLPKHTSSTTGYWIGENAVITPSDAGTDELEITPKKAAILTKFSGNLLREGTVVGIEQFVRNDLATKMALHIQDGFLEGLGSSHQPTGVYVDSNTTEVAFDTNTDATILSNLLLMVEELENAVGGHRPRGEARWLMHPRAKHRIGSILYGGTSGGPILTGPYGGDWRVSQSTQLLGYEVVDTGAITIQNIASSFPDETDIMLAYWSEVILAMWGTMELMASPVAGDAFAYDQIWTRAIQEVDVQIMHPETLIKGTDLHLNVTSAGSGPY